ncbi:protein trichome birefringence-like 2 [Quercus lobata]|uniref:Trichome birefringence-like N-terminal domain-containing protein n=1 Tax=Quercus lobata TaxID=97700 RepID=A0A7N2L994_QUELO|nr:protein trichome birefringence-like 2 [Quercus lobata]
MEMRKLPLSEQFVLPRRNVFSGFGLGIGVSLLVVVVLLLNKSLVGKPWLQGFVSVGVNSTLPFSSTSGSLSPVASNTNATSKVESDVGSFQGSKEGHVPYKTHEANVSGDSKVGDLKEARMGSGKTHFGNLTESLKNGSFPDKEKVGDSLASDGGLILRKNNSGNFSKTVKDESLRGKEGIVIENLSLSSVKDMNSVARNSSNRNNGTENKNVGNFSYNAGLDKAATREEIAYKASREGNSDEKNKSTISNYGSLLRKMDGGSNEKCDIFDGRWVRDDSKPYYPAGSCPHIDRDFDCHLHQRPDDGFLKWKWQPNGCDIPSLNATDFLERVRGKRLAFVGDSLNRNMWESLVCILRHAAKNKDKVYEISGRTEFKKKGIYAFRFEDYNCSLDFVPSPFLVRESSFKGRSGSFETLRLDLMDQTTSMYHDADVLVFNTGHWWTHDKTSRGEDYYQEGNYVHPRLKVLEAYKRALTTWARWVDKNIDFNRTQVFFRGYSLTHFRGGQWNSGGQCHKETEPIFNETYLAKYPSKMRTLEHVLQSMRSPVVYMNISRLTDYRKDGHPSVYRREYKTVEEQNAAAEQFQDCSHWCLPGVPDTWNELLYASLLKLGKGSWKN